MQPELGGDEGTLVDDVVVVELFADAGLLRVRAALTLALALGFDLATCFFNCLGLLLPGDNIANSAAIRTSYVQLA